MYHWTKDFTGDEYTGLLRTYPDHMKITQSVREQFFNEIHTVIDKNDGVITVYYTMDLQLARKA